MKIKFNKEIFGYYKFSEGYIIFNKENFNSFYIDDHVFQLLKPTLTKSVFFEEISKEEYEFSDYIDFINELIEKEILIKCS